MFDHERSILLALVFSFLLASHLLPSVRLDLCLLLALVDHFLFNRHLCRLAGLTQNLHRRLRHSCTKQTNHVEQKETVYVPPDETDRRKHSRTIRKRKHEPKCHGTLN